MYEWGKPHRNTNVAWKIMTINGNASTLDKTLILDAYSVGGKLHSKRERERDGERERKGVER